MRSGQQAAKVIQSQMVWKGNEEIVRVVRALISESREQKSTRKEKRCAR